MNRQETVEFVRSYFDTHDPVATDLSHRYPFRRRFDHCLGCSIWARKVAVAERANAELAEIAALFHDIGKATSDTNRDHGQLGAVIRADYLRSIQYEDSGSALIVDIVSRHSRHGSEANATLEDRIVSDADLLDETGSIAILWDAMACALEPDPSYEKAYERSLRMTAPLMTSLPQRLHTSTGKRIAQRRFAVVNGFLQSLESELGRGEIDDDLSGIRTR
jgi:putative nucleotidyltransferase with HDIG domain